MKHDVRVACVGQVHGLCCCAHGLLAEDHRSLSGKTEVNAPQRHLPRDCATSSASRGMRMLDTEHLLIEQFMACAAGQQHIRMCWHGVVGGVHLGVDVGEAN